tara:strand:- start:2934 stop:3146 length:213 start_codon:yes stop_codon:yes gene_type:complete
MTLDDYRLKRGWSYSELARQVGANHAAIVRRWCLNFGHSNRSIPNELYMERIINMSMGEVMPNDFYMRRE